MYKCKHICLISRITTSAKFWHLRGDLISRKDHYEIILRISRMGHVQIFSQISRIDKAILETGGWNKKQLRNKKWFLRFESCFFRPQKGRNKKKKPFVLNKDLKLKFSRMIIKYKLFRPDIILVRIIVSQRKT